MNRLQQVLAQIRATLARLDVSQKLLLGSLSVILVMTLFLVSQYAGRADMVEVLPGANTEAVSRAASVLRTSGITNEVRDGKLMVPASSEAMAVARLAEQRAMPTDSTEILFDNLHERQDWTMSKEQQRQLFDIATQNQLARYITAFDGIRSASVILDVPPPNGIGMAMRQPTASVTVSTNTGGALPQRTVDAIADLVAGARAGLGRERVRVVDAATGRSRRATDEDSAASGDYIEHAGVVETRLRNKLLDQVLGHIPGVQIAVTAAVDVTRRSTQTERYLPEGQGSLSMATREATLDQSQKNVSNGAEPGVRSNQAADINYAGGTGQENTQNDSETEFAPFPGREVQNVVDPRGMPTRVAVSIGIPRGFIEAMIEPEDGGEAPAEGEPAEIPLEQVLLEFEEFEPRIRAAIIPHIRTMSLAEGLTEQQISESVSVSMLPVHLALAAGRSQSAGLFGVGGGLLAGGGGIIDRVLLVGLALVSMGLMLMLVRKASKQPDLPSAQELVGVPPPLETASDLIGEADESETPLAGIEVDDEHVRAQKLLEQVVKSVGENPEPSARLLGRWIASDE